MPFKTLHRFRWLLAAPLGGLATLGHAPYGQWYLAVLALALLFALAARATPRQALALGWLFGVAHFLTGLYWVYISTHVYGGAPAWLGVLLLVVLAAYLALYPALALVAATSLRLWHRPAGWFGVPAAWLLSELVRGWFYSGFPWLSLGEAMVDTPLARLLPLLGVHGVSAVVALGAYALLRLGWEHAPRARALTAAALVAPMALSALLPAPGAWTRPAGAAVPVALVQSDIRQDEKWLPHMRYEALLRHWRLTQQAWPAALVVWPEVALTQPYDQIKDSYLARLEAQAREREATLVLGLLVVEDGVPRNSVFALGASQGRYDKRHLVPFGEYFPIPDFLRPVMDVLDLPYSDFISGAGQQPLVPAAGYDVDVSICFEDVFGDEIRRRARDAAMLVNVTNDAWFGDSSAPHQHLAFSRLRAMENGRWMLRSANTGVTALISPDGVVTARLPQFEQGVLRGEVEPRQGQTPYQRWGNLPLWVLSALTLLVLAARQKGLGTRVRRAAAPSDTAPADPAPGRDP